MRLKIVLSRDPTSGRWLGEVPALGASAHGANLTTVRRRLRRELALIWDDAERAESIEFVEHYDIGKRAQVLVWQSKTTHEEVEDARRLYRRRTRKALLELMEELGVSRHDASEILGLSPSLAARLARGSEPPGTCSC